VPSLGEFNCLAKTGFLGTRKDEQQIGLGPRRRRRRRRVRRREPLQIQRPAVALERVRERDGEGRRQAAALERAVDALERLAEVVERRRRGRNPICCITKPLVAPYLGRRARRRRTRRGACDDGLLAPIFRGENPFC